jgi:hypothetical protein
MNPILEITFKGIDGKKVVILLDDTFGYYSILGACEGAISEFIVRPEDEIKYEEEYDG